MRYADEHAAEFSNPTPLPLTDSDIDALARNWYAERNPNRNTP